MTDNLDYLIRMEEAIDYKCQDNLTFMSYWVELMQVEILTPQDLENWRTKLHFDRMADTINSHHFALLEFVAESLCPQDICRVRGLEEIEGSIIKSLDGGREYVYENGNWVLMTWEF